MIERTVTGTAGTPNANPRDAGMDPWVYRLKAAYDAGYYRTESAEAAQTNFPWQNKTCKDCPFWANSICQVHNEYRSSMAPTCRAFDPGNREAARAMLRERELQGVGHWWEWLNDRGAAR